VNTNTGITRQLMRTARRLEAEWRKVLRGSVGTGTNEGESSTGRVRAAGFHHVTARSRLARVLELRNRLFFLISIFFSGRGKPRITETADSEPMNTGARL
jgi:hypothetical protein